MAHPSLLYDEMSGLENLRYFARSMASAAAVAMRTVAMKVEIKISACEEVIRAVGLIRS